MKHLFTLNKYFAKYKWHLLLGILCVSLSKYFSVLVPQTIRKALDFVFEKVEANKNAEVQLSDSFLDLYGNEIMLFSAKLIGFSILMGIFMYLMRQTIIVMSRLIEFDLRNAIFSKYEMLNYQFYKVNKTGDLMSRITEDVSKVRMYLGPGLLYGINLVSLFIIVIFAMYRVSPTLTFYTLIPLPFLSISIYYISRIINKKSELIQEQLAKITTVSQEVYSGIRVVKSYEKSDKFNTFFDDQSTIHKKKSLELARVNALFFPLMILLIGLSTLLTIYMGGVLAARGEITPGNIAEFVIYVNYLTWPFTSIGWIASLVQQAEASQKRINEFLNADVEIKDDGLESNTIKGKIEFRNVNFHYKESGIKAIDNLSFTLNQGEKLAIVGLTASGKSTIAELLLRTYDIDEGAILIDDKNITKHNLSTLRRSIGYVPQDVFLFSDSIYNNIGFGMDKIDPISIENVAKNCAVHEDIIGFENGYETEVGERGVTLSGGQKQRISIARALIKDPKIVILDDSLSAVDTKTEKKITDFLETTLKGRTSILITHRMSSLTSYKNIIVLDKGKIIEQGSHTELIAKGGFYSDMVDMQKYEYTAL